MNANPLALELLRSSVNNTKKNCVTKKTKPDVTEFQPQIKSLLIGSLPSLLTVFVSIPYNESPKSMLFLWP